MPQSAEPLSAMLAAWGFERILAIPALPAANALEHGYATVVQTGTGEEWSLRSLGTQFSLVARGWLRQGMTRCYSLGWGLTPAGQSDAVLLAQAFEPDDTRVRQLGEQLDELLRPVATHLTWEVSGLWGRSCVRLAADLARSHA